MIIDSPFHDYYDCIAKQGVERSIRYKRVREVVDAGYGRRPWGRAPWDKSANLVIVFCGKVYRCIKSDNCDSTPDFFYSIDELDSYIRTNYSAKCWDFYCGRTKRLRRWARFGWGQRKDRKEFFDDKGHKDPEVINRCVKFADNEYRSEPAQECVWGVGDIALAAVIVLSGVAFWIELGAMVVHAAGRMLGR